MNDVKNKVPMWFWIASVFFLLWNILGVLSFVGHAFMSHEDMTAEQVELLKEFPIWTYVVFAIAVATGFLGSVALLMRKKWANLMFLVSLIAVLIQMTHNVFLTKSIEVYGMAQAITMPILVVVLAVILVWFSRFSTKKTWLN